MSYYFKVPQERVNEAWKLGAKRGRSTGLFRTYELHIYSAMMKGGFAEVTDKGDPYPERPLIPKLYSFTR